MRHALKTKVMRKPTIVNRQTVAQSRFFGIDVVSLRFTNGAEAEYECLSGKAGVSGSVLIVAIDDDNNLLLVREYAVGTDRYELVLPQGKIESREDPLKAANRELMEEVGYGAHRLKRIRTLSAAPGYLPHCTEVFLARDLYQKSLLGDEPEALEIIRWSINNIDDLLQVSEFSGARSIAALFLVRQHLAQTSNREHKKVRGAPIVSPGFWR